LFFAKERERERETERERDRLQLERTPEQTKSFVSIHERMMGGREGN
jgi:hypothetical protein